jgi:hypothetical protein
VSLWGAKDDYVCLQVSNLAANGPAKGMIAANGRMSYKVAFRNYRNDCVKHMNGWFPRVLLFASTNWNIAIVAHV